MLAQCHTPTSSLVAYTFFTGLVVNQEELLDAVSSVDDAIPEKDLGDKTHPQKMAVLQLKHLEEEVEAAKIATRTQVMAEQDEAHRGDAATRVAAPLARSIPTTNPVSSWLGDVVEGATPIYTSVRHSSQNHFARGVGDVYELCACTRWCG